MGAHWVGAGVRVLSVLLVNRHGHHLVVLWMWRVVLSHVVRGIALLTMRWHLVVWMLTWVEAWRWMLVAVWGLMHHRRVAWWVWGSVLVLHVLGRKALRVDKWVMDWAWAGAGSWGRSVGLLLHDLLAVEKCLFLAGKFTIVLLLLMRRGLLCHLLWSSSLRWSLLILANLVVVVRDLVDEEGLALGLLGSSEVVWAWT